MVCAQAESIKLSHGPESENERRDFIFKIQNNIHRKEAIVISASQHKSVVNKDYNQTRMTSYRNGDFYYLLGDGGDQWGEKEWTYFYSFSKWAVKHYFRMILNPFAFAVDVREAVQNPNTSAIVWSAHGSSDGLTYDAEKKALPKDVFTKDAGPNFVRLILSNCFSSVSVDWYAPKAETTYWEGTTNSQALFDYLNSDEFDASLLKAMDKTQW